MKNSFMRKGVTVVLVATLLSVGAFSPTLITKTAQAAEISLSELIDLFLGLNIIPANKATLARSIVANQETTTGGICPYTWTRNLTIGSSGQDVKMLQQYLNTNPATRVAASGVGSVGAETTYFGPRTAQALIRFQNMHSVDVLRPVGLLQGTGYFGALTRAKVNNLCVQTTPPVVTNPDTNPSAPTAPQLGQNEANLTRYRVLNDVSSVDVEEGENKEVMSVQFQVQDADVTLSRADIHVQAVGTVRESRPWNLLRELSLYEGNSRIATMRVDTRSAWTEVAKDVYRVRFGNLTTTFDEDTKPILTVRASVQNSVDTSDTPQDLALWFPDTGLRFRDTARIDHYLGSNSNQEVMIVQQAGTGEELVIRQAKDNPVESTLQVQKSNVSDEHTLLAFEIQAKNHDITLEELPVTIYTYNSNDSAVSFEKVVNKIWIEVEGVKYDDIKSRTTTNTTLDGKDVTATTLVFTFGRDDLQIAEDEKTQLELIATFRRQNGSYEEGQEIHASITRDNVSTLVAEGANNLSEESKNGQAGGATHTLRTEGIFLNAVSAIAKSRGNTSQQGEYSVTFTIEAFENDFYIPLKTTLVDEEGAIVLGSEDGGLRYQVIAANVTSTGTANAILTSNARREGEAYIVREGTQETFTLIVNYTPLVTDFYRVTVDSVGYRLGTQTNTEASFEKARPQNNFETEYVHLQK
jgi:peptidoglycan hydrolase-like protein with peptidoglycan-binding domain